MKIRNGFVSNSSSSSFLIFGIAVEEESKIADLLKTTKFLKQDEYPRLRVDPNGELLDEDEIESMMDDGIGEVLYLLLQDSELEHAGNGDYGHFIGRCWSTVGDNETGGQFKQSVRDLLDAMGFDGSKASTCEGSYYN